MEEEVEIKEVGRRRRPRLSAFQTAVNVVRLTKHVELFDSASVGAGRELWPRQAL